MAYHLYHTEGIVLGSTLVGESNRFYFIFTRDLGFVGAAAQGVRELKSKLRGHLTDYVTANVTFVRGRDVWRLISAEEVLGCSMHDIEKRRVLARIASLVRRLVHGEERNRELYDCLKDLSVFLTALPTPLVSAHAIEALAALRVLNILGYVAPTEDEQVLLVSPWTLELILEGEKRHKALVERVNNALRESQL